MIRRGPAASDRLRHKHRRRRLAADLTRDPAVDEVEYGKDDLGKSGALQHIDEPALDESSPRRGLDQQRPDSSGVSNLSNHKKKPLPRWRRGFREFLMVLCSAAPLLESGRMRTAPLHHVMVMMVVVPMSE